ncbi:MAG: oligosaccharide flippase family protein [Synechococcales cyanobacterium C42_A2020_086]|jgi:O-antigen/teichoic acid export membrane protein|nr:oligosaccharide flippase family protein [Synechococcales cyanobacterium C42_A2020_086]
MTSLEKLAIRGAVWTFVGYGSSQILRFIGNLILTRLLVPELFGLMALVYTFITGLNLFSDIGIRPSIIQNQRGDDPVFLNTAWTLQVIRGWILWFCCFLVALPVSRFYEEPRLLWLLPLVGATAAIEGFSSTALATLSRNVAVAKLTVFEVGVQVASLLVTVLWAYFDRSIWALVGGSLFASLFRVIWSYQIEPGVSNRFAWDKSALTDLTQFGRWIFLSTAMTFLATQADRLILGKLFSLDMLGVYTVAFAFADLPNAIITQINGKVIFPIVSRRADLPRHSLRQKILQKRLPLLLGLAILIALLSSFGDVLIHTLYDTRYRDAAWMLSILVLGIWFLAISRTIHSSLLAVGKPIYGAFGFMLKFLYLLGAVPLGFAQFGAVGAIVAMAFSDLPFYSVISYGAWREKLATTRQDILVTLLLIGLLISLGAGRALLGFGSPFHPITGT